MRYYSNRMEWGTLCQVKVDVLLLCSEMEINLKARKQNPWRKKNNANFIVKIILSLNIKVPA